MVAYFMIANLVMLWYCSVSTESAFSFVVGTGIVAKEKTDGGVYMQLQLVFV